MDKMQFDMVQIVRSVPLFLSLTRQDWEDVAEMLVGRCYPKDAYIIQAGEPPDALYIVWEGQVKILRHSEEGRDIVLDVIGPGHMFGEMAVFDGMPYSASAQAMEDVAVVAISRPDFFRLLERHPGVSLAVISELSRRLRNASDLVHSLAVERVERRIARMLLKLAASSAQYSADGLVIDLPLTRQDIADMTGTTVETAIRVMSRFRKEGLITTERGRVVVLDPEGLRSVAEER
ncbi:MAG: Crp/Fnr family transcriptional regulator [Anaerolineae bacterium]|nr:Crp/Fnr family transcriptional regulator [Anaerolineae bacterium]